MVAGAGIEPAAPDDKTGMLTSTPSRDVSKGRPELAATGYAADEKQRRADPKHRRSGGPAVLSGASNCRTGQRQFCAGMRPTAALAASANLKRRRADRADAAGPSDRAHGKSPGAGD